MCVPIGSVQLLKSWNLMGHFHPHFVFPYWFFSWYLLLNEQMLKNQICKYVTSSKQYFKICCWNCELLWAGCSYRAQWLFLLSLKHLHAPVTLSWCPRAPLVHSFGIALISYITYVMVQEKSNFFLLLIPCVIHKGIPIYMKADSYLQSLRSWAEMDDTIMVVQ